MESLDGTNWDVVIAGTGLPQSLLALSLSRSGKNILHLDRNEYYGGNEAAFSLSEAEEWAKKHNGSDCQGSTFDNAVVDEQDANDGAVKLSQPRAYSLALAPQITHAQSSMLSTLVSSRIHNQLEFQAVGSWFIVEPQDEGNDSRPAIFRVPSSREDIFQDTSVGLKGKRALMKFLRFVQTFEEQPESWEHDAEKPFPDFLQQKFDIPQNSLAPLLALTLGADAPQQTSTAFALPRIARHLRGIGVFGPGFGAVLPKWGGLAEIAQVACRAGAVGGGVYVLKKGIDSISELSEGKIELGLSGGEKVTTAWVTGCPNDIPSSAPPASNDGLTRSITIVAPSLQSFFPPTSEGGVKPAGAVALVPADSPNEPPVHIILHSHESGECPSSQSVLYASVALPVEEGRQRLNAAVQRLLQGADESSRALWSLTYHQKDVQQATSPVSNVIVLPNVPLDLGMPDSVLDNVKLTRQQMTGETEGFMVFDAREGMEDDD